MGRVVGGTQPFACAGVVIATVGGVDTRHPSRPFIGLGAMGYGCADARGDGAGITKPFQDPTHIDMLGRLS
jgi:hypothetical protein